MKDEHEVEAASEFKWADNQRGIYKVDFMRLVDGRWGVDLSEPEIKSIRLVEPATSPRLVVEIVFERASGFRTSIEIPWHNLAALHWRTGGNS